MATTEMYIRHVSDGSQGRSTEFTLANGDRVLTSGSRIVAAKVGETIYITHMGSLDKLGHDRQNISLWLHSVLPPGNYGLDTTCDPEFFRTLL